MNGNRVVSRTAALVRGSRPPWKPPCVAPATRDGQYAVTLKRFVGGAAVCAATPSRFQGNPFGVAEVVVDAVHPALASAGDPGPATSIDRHWHSLGTGALERSPIKAALGPCRRGPAATLGRSVRSDGQPRW
jgi:hypothetical protein